MKAMNFQGKVSKDSGGEAGNVLWVILIGVVLLASLGAVLSRSGSNIENTADAEKVSVQALHIMRYARSIENAVQNLQFQDIGENDLSFENPISGIDYTNANCTSTDCRIFHIGGAGLSYLTPKAVWLDRGQSASVYYGDWLFTGNACVPDIGRGVDASCTSSVRNLELLAVLPYVRLSLCQQVNKLAKLSVGNGAPPSDVGAAFDGADGPFVGGFADAQAIADTAEVLFGETTGCFEGASGVYHFYHVLKAR